MSKQIKVSDDVYARLKGYADANYRTITGQIDFLLGVHEGKIIREPAKEPEHSLEGVFQDNKSDKSENIANAIHSELPCCEGAQRCKHWQWDVSTGDGWVNTLSGRKK